MENKDNCEFCYLPRPASGCGWVIVSIVGLFVLICIIAGVYHEIAFHDGPVAALPARDSMIEAEGQPNILGSPESTEDTIPLPYQKTWDSIRKTFEDSACAQNLHQSFEMYNIGTFIGVDKGFVSIVNDHGSDTISIWFNDTCIARGLTNGRILCKDSLAYDRAKEFVRKVCIKIWGDSL